MGSAELPHSSSTPLHPNILACVDGSTYTYSVCDYAAWFAGRMDGVIDVLNVAGPEEGSVFPNRSALLSACLERIANEGASVTQSRRALGSFCEVAAAARADLIVLGKRGAASDAERRALGSHVEMLIRATSTPICLTSKVFLPIRSALALLDSDVNHRAAVEFVASHQGLRDLDFDLVVTTQQGADPGPKLDWARSVLSAGGADVFPVEADGPQRAMQSYMENRRADILVISREVLLATPKKLRRFEEGSLWAWRTPVLVC